MKQIVSLLAFLEEVSISVYLSVCLSLQKKAPSLEMYLGHQGWTQTKLGLLAAFQEKLEV